MAVIPEYTVKLKVNLTGEIQPATFPVKLAVNLDGEAKIIEYPVKLAINMEGSSEPVAPSDILLSNNDIDENNIINEVIGALSADGTDPITFTLVVGTGDDDNASFEISGANLRTLEVFDFETKLSYSIRVRATNSEGNVEQQFTITINDVVEAPPPEVEGALGILLLLNYITPSLPPPTGVTYPINVQNNITDDSNAIDWDDGGANYSPLIIEAVPSEDTVEITW